MKYNYNGNLDGVLGWGLLFGIVIFHITFIPWGFEYTLVGVFALSLLWLLWRNNPAINRWKTNRKV